MSMPELERGGRHQRAQRAGLEPLLGVEPPLAREAAVVAGDRVLAQQLRELRRDALGHLARVHEHERGAVARAPAPARRCVDLVPLLVRAHGRERRRRDLDRAGRARGTCPRRPAGTRGRCRPGTRRPPPAASASPRARRAAAAGRRAPRAARARARGARRACRAPARGSRPRSRCASCDSIAPAARRGEQQVQRLRRRDQDVRRPLRHRRALAAGGVAGAHQHADLGQARVQRADLARAAAAGSSGRRSRARAAARRRRPGSRPAESLLAEQLVESRTGSPRASCPIRSAPRSATLRPSWISGQPSRWGALGSPRRDSNHARTAGWKRERRGHVLDTNRSRVRIASERSRPSDGCDVGRRVLKRSLKLPAPGPVVVPSASPVSRCTGPAVPLVSASHVDPTAGPWHPEAERAAAEARRACRRPHAASLSPRGPPPTRRFTDTTAPCATRLGTLRIRGMLTGSDSVELSRYVRRAHHGGRISPRQRGRARDGDVTAGDAVIAGDVQGRLTVIGRL